jgi:hypothetical protein
MIKKLFMELFIGLGIMMVSGWVIFYSSNIEAKAANFPFYISILLFGLGAILVVRDLITIYQKKNLVNKLADIYNTDTPAIFDLLKTELLPYSITALCLLFIWALPVVGFEISAFCLIFAVMILIKSKVTLSTILLSLIVPALLIIIFRLGLNIRIPLALEMYLS